MPVDLRAFGPALGVLDCSAVCPSLFHSHRNCGSLLAVSVPQAGPAALTCGLVLRMTGFPALQA